MISYERISGYDINKNKESVKCMICRYYYSRMDYQPYVCNGLMNFPWV